ncbi:hypothetical protein [Sphingopyxis sp. QXT-31]|uniref:hypothetical protein n=1 Tax=Sphingopyxis sp. QXT-31 TaxID=1357916 RepID=UPI0012EB3FC2|nr:hypothetical protein [Sphingopyxis sp. QXT-31]
MNDLLPKPIEKIGFSLGVGSIFFAPKNGEIIDKKDYFESIKKELLKIENISKLKFSRTDGQFGCYIEYQHDEDIHVPHIYDAEISFNLFVSREKQKELGFWCGDENISFILSNHYYHPVCYVFSQERKNEFDASTSVAMVRQYLREKLEDSDILLCCVGPSPFHAEFIFFETEEPKNELQDVSEGFGYKAYISETKSLDEAILYFSEKYGSTFSLFYHLHNLRSKCLNLQAAIVNDTQEKIEEISSGSKFSKTKNIVSSESFVDHINMSSLRDIMARSEMISLIDENFNESQNKDINDELEFHFRDLVRFSKDASHMAAMDIVRNIETRRQSFFQNFSVLVAGLMGGILGAILGSTLTIMLSK